MESNEIKSILKKSLILDEVYISNDGNHFLIIAVSQQFAGMSQLKKQQTIYGPLMKYIADNRIHSLSIRAFTPDEWQSDQKLNRS
ncbi:BolA family protein [Sodalis sp. CWE]|uniref:BolA family protein n=1 Tax=Sodalis sp. CWE TaxID=2803816 RepID=UPI001C7E0BD2|nr:BolA family protein [Sodalis sp. CWE]MBX4180839.1 BolA family transcriptional regulator [Sodalis sp. CWE]